MSSGRILIPHCLASSMMTRGGYMPGSCVSTPAKNAAAWCRFSQADWYVGSANAAACALQKPKAPNASSTCQARSTAVSSKPLALAMGTNVLRTSSRPSGVASVRRNISANDRSRPVITSMILSTCSWNTTTPCVSFSASRSLSCG
jgi:hypothetical protein